VKTHASPSVADAQHFLDTPQGGTETSEGDVGVYRYRELRSGGTETFVLESLLPGTAMTSTSASCGLEQGISHQAAGFFSPQIYR